MSQGWTTIFMGPPAEAEVLRGELEARGIPVFIPDDALRTIDPFMVGGLLIFDRAVQVPDSAAVRVRECLRASDNESEMREGEQELPADFFEGEPKNGDEAELSAEVVKLSRRILWCSILPIGAPFILWEIGQYLNAVRRLGRKPPMYRTTVAAACISPVYFAATFVPIIWELRGH